MENHPQDVLTALNLVVDEIEREIRFLEELAKKYVDRRAYETAEEALELIKAVQIYLNNVEKLRGDWMELAQELEAARDEKTLSLRRKRKNARNGERTPRRRSTTARYGELTPRKAYYRPILQALEERGGSARMSEVLDRVYELIQDELKPIDYEHVPSLPDTPRWKNTAGWARYSMVKEGLLRGDSPHGIWELTEKGREWLRGSGEEPSG